MHKKYPNSLEEYLAHTRIQDKCLIWTGSKNRQGYGACTFEGRTHGIHVLVYAATNNVHPSTLSGYDIHHKCQNKACINYEHLEKLTRSEHLSKEHPLRNHIKQFCKRGHDVSICGRNKARQCNECVKIYSAYHNPLRIFIAPRRSK